MDVKCMHVLYICVGEKIGAPEKEQKYFSKHHFQSTICLRPWNLQQ